MIRWMAVARACVGACALEPRLVDIYGRDIRAAGSAKHVVPCLEWSLITNTHAPDIWEPIVIQWDQFVKTEEQLESSERALSELFNQDLPVAVLGVYLWSVFDSGAEIAAPAEVGYYGRAVRFRYTPIQEAFAR